jgi:hypothetical protein
VLVGAKGRISPRESPRLLEGSRRADHERDRGARQPFSINEPRHKLEQAVNEIGGGAALERAQEHPRARYGQRVARHALDVIGRAPRTELPRGDLARRRARRMCVRSAPALRGTRSAGANTSSGSMSNGVSRLNARRSVGDALDVLSSMSLSTPERTGSSGTISRAATTSMGESASAAERCSASLGSAARTVTRARGRLSCACAVRARAGCRRRADRRVRHEWSETARGRPIGG